MVSRFYQVHSLGQHYTSRCSHPCPVPFDRAFYASRRCILRMGRGWRMTRAWKNYSRVINSGLETRDYKRGVCKSTFCLFSVELNDFQTKKTGCYGCDFRQKLPHKFTEEWTKPKKLLLTFRALFIFQHAS